MTSRITWDEASARRYERQLLGAPAPAGTPVAGVVSTLLATHAQVLSAAELSVGLRLDGATRQDVRAALWDDRSLVKTYGPRGTIHLLAAAELPFWSAALTAVPSGAGAPPGVRMTPGQEEQVVAAIGDALDGRQLTIDELSEEVVARTGPWAGDLVMEAFQGKWPRWRQVMHRTGQSGALCFAPNRGRKAAYTRPPRFDPLPADEALATLVRHYLHAYGPATPQHFAKWAAAPRGWAAGLFTTLASSGGIEEVDFEGAPAGWWRATRTSRQKRYVGCGCSPTSTRTPSPPSPASGCSPARRTSGPWRAGRRGTFRCCSSTVWSPGSGTSGGRGSGRR